MTGGRERLKTLLWTAWAVTGGLMLLLWYAPRGTDNLVLLGSLAAWGVGGWLLRELLKKTPTVLAEVIQVPVDRVLANPYRVRVVPDPATVEGLERSIESFGILAPLLVRARGDKFEVVDGQRRLLAAKRLGREWVPAIVRNLSDKELLEATLLNNLQRIPLSPVEEARAFSRLRREFEEGDPASIAAQMGMDPEWAASRERLLSLPEVVAQAAILGQITGAHAEALAELADSSLQIRLLRHAVEEKWDAERLREEVRALLGDREGEEAGEGSPPAPPSPPPIAPAEAAPEKPPKPPAPPDPEKPPPSYGTFQI